MALARPSRSRRGSSADGQLDVLLAAPMLEAPSAFAAAIEAALPQVRIWADGAVADNAVDVVIIDDHASLLGRRLVRASTALSLSAGVEHLFGHDALAGARIYRVLTPKHQQLMREYVIHQLLASQVLVRHAEELQRCRRWEWLPPRTPLAGRHALVLGLGFLGNPCAQALRDLGLVVTGLNRTGCDVPGINVVSDQGGLAEALQRTDFLVCLLPLTPETNGMIGARQLALLPRHAVVVNASRPACIDQAALIELLRSRRLAGAVLDVIEREPVPPNDPIWQVPNLTITPHCAATPPTEAYLPAIIEALARLQSGEVPRNPVEPLRGY
jgi:glyoxylate/hydroxypyruvate reductase